MNDAGKELAVEMAKDMKIRISQYISDLPDKIKRWNGQANLEGDNAFTMEERLMAPEGTSLIHLLWMCDQIVNMTQEWEVSRLHRWVGYIQGVMVHGGISTLEEEKDAVHEKKKSFSEG